MSNTISDNIPDVSQAPVGSKEFPDPKKFTSFSEYLEAQKPIKLMGVLSYKEVQEYIATLEKSFLNLNKEHIVALIQRESGGDPRVKSPTGSMGIMQLTTSVFDDMHRLGGRGRGISEYLDNFKKIKPEVIQIVAQKSPQFATIIKNIQNLSSKDQEKFTLYTKQLQDITTASTNRGEIEINLLMGSLYLDSISDRSIHLINNPRQKDISMLKGIMKGLRRVKLVGINEMLTAKNFLPLKQPEFTKQIEDIINDKEKFKEFLINYTYNGQQNIDSDGSEHRIKYALALALSINQLQSRN